MAKRLKYTRGSTKPIVIDLVDVDGVAEDITGHGGVRFGISNNASKSDLISKTETDGLAITLSPASISYSPTHDESISLPEGKTLYVQAWVLLGGKWIDSEMVELVVSRGIGAPQS